MSGNESNVGLPKVALDFIESVVKKVRYRKKIRQEVREELTDHFYMAFKDCKTEQEKVQTAEEIISEFGDVRMLAGLIRRGKKRCRPLWRTVVVRTFQTIGISILCMILYSVWFISGKPNVETDYVVALSKHLMPEADDDNNAWANYKKAAELYKSIAEDDDFNEVYYDVKLPLSSLSREQRDGLNKWVEVNEQAWVEFSIAVEKEYLYREYGHNQNPDDLWLMNIYIPNLSKVKRLTQLAAWKSKLAMEQGESREAFEYCVKSMKASKHWMSQGTIIEYLVGLSVGGYGCNQALRLVIDGRFDPAELKAFRNEMSAVFSEGYPYCDLTGEEMFMFDAIQHYFTDGGPGGGHIAPRQLAKDLDEDYYDVKKIRDFLFGSIAHAGRNKTIAKAKEVYDKIEGLSRISPYERHARDISIDSIIKELPQYRYYIIHIFIPALEKVCNYHYQRGCEYQAVLTVLAIKQWEAEKGALPESLGVLVEAGLLDKVPDDPYSAGSLVYRVDGDGFMLYSVGMNFVDDGGEYGSNLKGGRRLWGGNGDAVFWPN